MFLLKAARAAVCGATLVAATHAVAQSPQTLTLDRAFAQAIAAHPDLKRQPLRRAAVLADADVAALPPPLVAGATLDNALGSGDYRTLRGAELSLTLGSVLEPRAAREARVGVETSRLAGIDIEAEAARLDVLADVARRYLDAVAAQADIDATAASVDQRRATVDAAARRVAAGASPRSVLLGAEAALARAELEHERARESARSARRRLALLWNERDPGFDRVAGNLLALPDVPEFSELAALLDRTPELQRFAGEARVREARLQLARTKASPEIEWQVGVRRLQESGDTALLGGVSLPLGSRARAAPGIRAAQAELDALATERDSGELGLYATLAEAHGRLRVDTLAARRLGDSVLPALERAEAAAASAYAAGALSYLEWSQLQADLLTARRERTAAARDAHLALIEIQRLTAEPFVLADGAARDITP